MQKYHHKLDTFFNEDATSFYLLGAFMTDGCVYAFTKKKQVSFTSKDRDWVEIIRDLICPSLPIKIDKNDICRLTICSTKLANWLIAKGCVQNKSLTMKFPQVPAKYLPDFVRGCIDGDGCIVRSQYTKNKNGKEYHYVQNVCYLCSSSPDFIRTFHQLYDTNNMKCYLHEQSNKWQNIQYKHPHYRVVFSGSNAKKFLASIYYHGHKVSMPRKHGKAKLIMG